jgi:hypothetical protein
MTERTPVAFPDPSVCVFCGIHASQTPDGTLTIEHAYPDWIRRRLNPQGSVQWHLDGQTLPGREVFEVEIKALCRDCNSGWLDKYFEKKVSKWIGDTLRDAKRPFALDQHQREVLAAWAVKTALMIELATLDIRKPAFAPESHFRWLYEHRTTPTPPPACQVWLFGLNIGSGFAWHQLAWSRNALMEPSSLEEAPRAYFATFTAGYLGFQVFGPDLDGVDRPTPPKLPVLRTVKSVLNPVWPAPRRPPLRWPPSKWTNPASLEAFAAWPNDLLRRPPERQDEVL